jgi:hypothetical protein
LLKKNKSFNAFLEKEAKTQVEEKVLIFTLKTNRLSLLMTFESILDSNNMCSFYLCIFMFALIPRFVIYIYAVV